MSKKSIEINALLAWVYREEMPKLEAFENDRRLWWDDISVPSASPWEAISRLAVLGCRVDTTGPAPDDGPLVYPDPDALIVNKAVLGLDGAEISRPEDWSALGDCIGLTDEERADAHSRGWTIAMPKGDRLAALVMRRAITGRVPSWRDHGSIYRRKVCGANGKPAWFRVVNVGEPGRPCIPREVDGYNRSRQRPYKGAYQKHYLDPCPSLLIAERIEYQLWALALHRLADDLRGRLAAFKPTCTVPLWPWEGEGADPPSRVLLVRPSTKAEDEGDKAA